MNHHSPPGSRPRNPKAPMTGLSGSANPDCGCSTEIFFPASNNIRRSYKLFISQVNLYGNFYSSGMQYVNEIVLFLDPGWFTWYKYTTVTF